MPCPYSNVWLSEDAEERVVLACLEKLARTGSTGITKATIKEFAKIGTSVPQYSRIVDALLEGSVFSPSDGLDDVYIFHPRKAVEYFSKKGKDPEKILKEFYPDIDLKGALKKYNQARKGKL